MIVVQNTSFLVDRGPTPKSFVGGWFKPSDRRISSRAAGYPERRSHVEVYRIVVILAIH